MVQVKDLTELKVDDYPRRLDGKREGQGKQSGRGRNFGNLDPLGSLAEKP